MFEHLESELPKILPLAIERIFEIRTFTLN